MRKTHVDVSAASVGGGVADAQILGEMRGRGDKRRKGNEKKSEGKERRGRKEGEN